MEYRIKVWDNSHYKFGCDLESQLKYSIFLDASRAFEIGADKVSLEIQSSKGDCCHDGEDVNRIAKQCELPGVIDDSLPFLCMAIQKSEVQERRSHTFQKDGTARKFPARQKVLRFVMLNYRGGFSWTGFAAVNVGGCCSRRLRS